MSDGTHVIRFVNPENFETIRTIVVLDEKGKPLMELNELEYIKGEIWANVWQTDYVARIDPATGAVTGYIDFRGLLTPGERTFTDVMNGIAWDEATDRLFITGKLWPRVFEVRVVRK